MPKLFMSITGDYPNIGDAFIRRQAVAWMRDLGRGLVYARDAPDVWIRSVGADGDDVMKSGRSRWLRAIVTSRAKPVVLYEPGEIDLGLAAFARELSFLVMIILVRLRRGLVVLPPRAVAESHPATLIVHRLSCRIASVAVWRDAKSFELIGAGSLAPDIAFWAEARTSGLPKTKIGVSLRAKRPPVDDLWIEAVTLWAKEQDLDLMTFSQVRDDETRSQNMAQRLGCKHVEWIGDDIAHEARLRAFYDQCAFVLSDRLHVLIISSLSGSVPIELVAGPAPKVADHFEQVGYRNLSIDTEGRSGTELAEFLARQRTRHAELASAMDRGRQHLNQVRLSAIRTLGMR